MKKVSHIGVMLIMTLAGCAASKPFQPTPPLYLSWKKEGADIKNVKVELVSCGYDNPGTGFNHRVEISQVAAAGRCMTKKGFQYLYGPTICEISQWSSLPECK